MSTCLLHHKSHQWVGMEGLQEHEIEAGGEEEMNEDGNDFAWCPVVVEARDQQANVGTYQGDLHVHLYHTTIVKDPQTCK